MLVKTTHNHVQPWLACPLSRGGKAFIMAEKARARGEEVRREEVRRCLVTVVREASGAPGVCCWIRIEIKIAGIQWYSVNLSHVAGDYDEQQHLISPNYRSYALCCFTSLSRRAPFCLIRTSARYPSKVLLGLKLVGWHMSVPTKVSSTVSSVPST